MNTISPENEWQCGISKNKVHQGYFLTGFLALVGISFITFLNSGSADASMLGLLMLAGSAAIGFMTYRNAQKSEILLILNNEGIWYKDWNVPTINWQHIDDIQLGGSKLKASIRLTLGDPNQVISQLDKEKRRAFEKNLLVALPILKIPAGNLESSLEEVRDKIKNYMVQK